MSDEHKKHEDGIIKIPAPKLVKTHDGKLFLTPKKQTISYVMALQMQLEQHKQVKIMALSKGIVQAVDVIEMAKRFNVKVVSITTDTKEVEGRTGKHRLSGIEIIVEKV